MDEEKTTKIINAVNLAIGQYDAMLAAESYGGSDLAQVREGRAALVEAWKLLNFETAKERCRWTIERIRLGDLGDVTDLDLALLDDLNAERNTA